MRSGKNIRGSIAEGSGRTAIGEGSQSRLNIHSNGARPLPRSCLCRGQEPKSTPESNEKARSQSPSKGARTDDLRDGSGSIVVGELRSARLARCCCAIMLLSIPFPSRPPPALCTRAAPRAIPLKFHLRASSYITRLASNQEQMNQSSSMPFSPGSIAQQPMRCAHFDNRLYSLIRSVTLRPSTSSPFAIALPLITRLLSFPHLFEYYARHENCPRD